MATKKEAEEKVTMTMEELEKMLAKYKAEAKEEILMEMNGGNERSKEEAQMFKELDEQKKHLNDPVTIQLFKDGNKYKDDVFVSVNDKTWLIQRGVPVTVPKIVAEVLQQSQEQDFKAAAYAEQQQREFREASIRLNI